MRTSARRRGFTIVELLISMMIVAIIGASLTRLIVAQSRFYDRQNLQKSARDVSRAALNIMQSDLRMVEETQGVRAASPTSVQLRVPVAVGYACNSTTIHLLPVDSALMAEALPQIEGIALREAATDGYESWTGSSTLTPTTAANCTAAGVAALPGGQTYTTASLSSWDFAGQPAMVYRKITYTIAASTMVPGSLGLWRRIGNGTNEELVAPLAAASGFTYYRLNSSVPGAAPGTLTEIFGIRVRLVGASERGDQANGRVQQADLVTSIYFKNRKV